MVQEGEAEEDVKPEMGVLGRDSVRGGGVGKRLTRSRGSLVAGYAGLVRVVRDVEWRVEEVGSGGIVQERSSCLRGFAQFVVHHRRVRCRRGPG